MDSPSYFIAGAAFAASLVAAPVPGSADLEIGVVDPPVAAGSQVPNLCRGADGNIYLSWVEPADEGGSAFRFTVWADAGWSAPKTVATGDDWFVNWADVPSMDALEDGTLMAHWLVREGETTYAYGIRVALSADDGETWSEPFRPHRDDTLTEHGFVSILPAADGFVTAWLDGRETTDEGDGAMTLRAATVSAGGAMANEAVVDGRVCDCCPTDAVRNGEGDVVLAYRDRSDTERRDVRLAVLAAGEWTAGALVHEDGWEVHGCPVNGPSLAASGTALACAWYTEGSDSTPRVRVAFSTDGGSKFGRPIRVDEGDPLGRCDVVLDDAGAIVVWLERDGPEASVRVRRVGHDGGLGASREIARVPGSRAAGFPRLVATDDGFLVAWTVPGDPPRVQTAFLH